MGFCDRATRAARKNRERVYPRGLSLHPSSLGPDLRTPSTGNQTCRGPTVAMQSPTSASLAHFLTRARRDWLLASYQRKHHLQCKAHISPCDNSGTLPGFSGNHSTTLSIQQLAIGSSIKP
ncbi:hypothetical protein J6590_061501 [Homalodisca vitripennis]|nr:hypothetical protein J6590_061501 [Homalodisca vitripennis]